MRGKHADRSTTLISIRNVLLVLLVLVLWFFGLGMVFFVVMWYALKFFVN